MIPLIIDDVMEITEELLDRIKRATSKKDNIKVLVESDKLKPTKLIQKLTEKDDLILKTSYVPKYIVCEGGITLYLDNHVKVKYPTMKLIFE